MSRNKKKKNQGKVWEAAYNNNNVFLYYYHILRQLALCRYKWLNLPSSVDERFMEVMIFENGHALYFNDPALGEICLPSTLGGQLNVYNIPKVRRAYASNGYNATLGEDDSVIIFNDYTRTTPDHFIRMFAYKLYECDQTILTNIRAQKTPLLIICREEQKLTMKNIYKDYAGNEPIIFAYDNYEEAIEEGFQVLKTDAPYVADKVQISKNTIWNEAMLYLGINNTNIDKRERMITDEANGNLEQIVISRYIGLDARKQAAKQIREMFHNEVDVQYNPEIQEIYDRLILQKLDDTNDAGGEIDE